MAEFDLRLGEMTAAHAPAVRARLPWPLLLAWLLIVGALSFVVLFVGALPYISGPWARIAVQLILAAAAAVTVVLVARRVLDVGTPLAIPGVVCIAVVAISAVTSREPAVSREALALLVLAATTYPLARYLVWDSALAPRITSLVVFAAIGLITAYLVQVAALWIQWISRAGLSLPPLRPADAALSTGTVNSIATYFELLIPTAVWALHVRYGARASLTLAIAGLLAILITGTRGAWAGVAMAAVVVIALNGRAALDPIRRRVAGSGLRAASIATVAIVIAVVGLVALLPRILAGDAGRFELWSAAIGLGLARPVFGNGPGTWQDLRASFPIDDAATAALFTAHNSVLHVFAETGIVGLASVAFLVGTIAWLAVRAVRAAQTTTERGFALAAIASLVAVGVHSLVDPLFGVPAVAVLTVFVIARLDRPAIATPRMSGARPAAVLAVAATVAVALLIPVDVAMLRATNGNAALSRADWQSAATDFDAAIALDDRPVYRAGQALAAAGLGDLDKARAALATAHATGPLTFLDAAQARLAMDAGDDGEASRLAHDVLAAGPYDPTATVNAADVVLKLGDRDGATAGLADAMQAEPSLIYSERPPAAFDDEVWAAARRQALAGLAETNPEMAAFATIRGRAAADDVASALDALPDGPARRALEILDATERSGSVDLPAIAAV
ncbi:MAG: O-antigen ligase family protein, partial [Chloroflexota bacterium]